MKNRRGQFEVVFFYEELIGHLTNDLLPANVRSRKF